MRLPRVNLPYFHLYRRGTAASATYLVPWGVSGPGRQQCNATEFSPIGDTRANSVIVEEFPPSITRLTLDRPSSLNALSAPLIVDLASALHKIHNSFAQRIVILQGAGSRAFCAGADLKETLAPQTHTKPELRRSLELLQEVTAFISGPSSRLISIAAVQGSAVGGGAEMALGCDFIVADPKAQFWFPEARLGYGVTGAVTARLAASIGAIRAKQMLLTGRKMSAAEGLTVGLLTEVVEDPKERALQLARVLENQSEVALRSIKVGVEKALFPRQETVLADELNAASSCMSPAETKAASKGCLEQTRRPNPLSTWTEDAEGLSTAVKRPSQEEKASNKRYIDDLMASIQQITAYENKDSFKEVKSQPRDLNTLLKKAAARSPESIFLRFGSKDVTYSRFLKHVRSLAEGLRQKGVASRDRVMVMMRNSLEMVAIWFATNWLGAVWVPINHELRSETLRKAMSSISAKLTVVDPEFRDMVVEMQTVPEESLYVNDYETNGPLTALSPPPDQTLSSLWGFNRSPALTLKSANIPPSAISTLIFTSGTTGPSKACSLSHEYFIHAAKSLSNALGFREDDVFYCPFPLSHIDAAALTIIPALRLGATAAISQRFSVSKFWSEIRESRATVYDFMGGTLALLYKAPPQPNNLDTQHNVRLAWGVPLSASWAEDYERRFGHRLYEVYGSSESGIPIAQHAPQPRTLGSCGRALPGYEVCIANLLPLPAHLSSLPALAKSDHQPLEHVPLGTPGELLIRSERPNAFFSGYFGNIKATTSTFYKGWLRTGDICRMNKDGDIFFVGRMKEMVRRMGENVSCAEVEDEFLSHPSVEEVAARGVPNPLGEMAEDALKIIVVLKGKDKSLTSKLELWEWAKTNLSRPHIPDVIQAVDELTRTSTGKVDRSQLPEQGGVSFSRR